MLARRPRDGILEGFPATAVTSLELLELREHLGSHYALEGEVGRGGMATVYRARDLRLGRDVAIKVLHEDLSLALGPERFRREIHIASQLSHPNILPIHDSGEVGGLLYFVMPFITGESLRTRIDRERQMPLEDAVQIGCEVASALDFAHRQGVIHRDVKPENILLGDGHAILADFGIARAIHAAGEDRLTRSGVTVGTPTYMSPEQATADANLDGRSDIYALGCCLYEMLAGVPPFVGPSAQVVIARHTLEQAPPLHVARPGVPEQVEATVLRALAKSPADRFRTAADFAAALSGRVAVTMPRMSGAGISAAPRRRRASLILAAVALVVGLGALSAWLLRPSHVARAGALELDPRRIAVLPFDDRTGGRLAYLADGLTAALIERLTGVQSLDVISMNGVEQIADNLPVDSAARVLRVGTVVQGSIDPLRGDSVRVTVRLIEGVSGVDFKHTTFAGSVNDPLKLRDELAERAADFLRARLGEETRLHARRTDTRSGRAWGLVQQAERVTRDAERLVEEDSLSAADTRFLRADSMLVDAEQLDVRWIEPVVLRGSIAYRRARLEEDRERAGGWIEAGLAHAERAIARDARNADALELRGTLRYLRWLLSLEPDPSRASALLRSAEADLRSAVSISPTNASAWSALSHLHYQKPDFTEAKLAALRAYEEDAYLSAAPDIVWRLYTTSYDLEDFSGASQWCAEGARRFADNPRFVECRLWLLTARARSADIPQAWALMDSLGRMFPPAERAVRRSEHQMMVAGAIARVAVADSTTRPALVDSARRVLMRARAGRGPDPEGELLGTEAFVRTLLGDKDEAFRLLKQYFIANPGHRALFAQGNTWWWRPLRDDPRFAELVGFQGH